MSNNPYTEQQKLEAATELNNASQNLQELITYGKDRPADHDRVAKAKTAYKKITGRNP